MEDVKMKEFKVLIVEDSEKWIEQYKRELEDIDELEIIVASTIEDANRIFKVNYDKFDAIGIDSHIHSNRPNTMEFIRMILKEIPNEIPVFAVTATVDDRKILINAGCNRGSSKKDFPLELCEALGLDISEFVA